MYHYFNDYRDVTVNFFTLRPNWIFAEFLILNPQPSSYILFRIEKQIRSFIFWENLQHTWAGFFFNQLLIFIFSTNLINSFGNSEKPKMNNNVRKIEFFLSWCFVTKDILANRIAQHKFFTSNFFPKHQDKTIEKKFRIGDLAHIWEERKTFWD